jgi:hypothetical protein
VNKSLTAIAPSTTRRVGRFAKSTSTPPSLPAVRANGDVPNEFVSLEGTDADEETKSPAADATEEDENVILLDEQDGQVYAREIIGADIEKDEA